MHSEGPQSEVEVHDSRDAECGDRGHGIGRQTRGSKSRTRYSERGSSRGRGAELWRLQHDQ
eukprot:9333955-Pyramimonas_sp.AAC.1